ncbi:unnamed protein product [Ceutorhynchus assimilis]|uniref:RecA family profile 1 domain-containing protein n=1 Tax=Ceutorhynchus assimilis TaxID=467358 RepID=A0A9N9MXY6_9CUCU|nr:unnamed protein product [Ceutorhynchus assimilis]
MDKIKSIIGPEAYSLLEEENLNTFQQIVMTDVNDLQTKTGCSLEEANKMVLTASEEILKDKFITADQIKPCDRISTGCENIDKILLGGLPVNGITEIYGCSGVGKTQFCLQLALNIQLPCQPQTVGKEVLYIATEDVFPSKRLNQLAQFYKAKHKLDFEDQILIVHIADSIQLQKYLVKLPHILSRKNVGLIILDSIAGIFRNETENPKYISRSQDFKLIATTLNNLQDQYNCGILVVNQVTDNVVTGLAEPSLGLSWANNVNCRLFFFFFFLSFTLFTN